MASGIDGPVGYGMGLAIGKPGGMIIRPELGVLIDRRDHQTFQFGIGFTAGPGKPQSKYEPTDTPH